MSIDLAALTAELTNDPKTLGYAALIAAHNRVGIAAKLNSTYAGVGTIWRTDLTSSEIMACLVWSEVSAANVTQWTSFQTLLIPPTVDASKAAVRALFAGLFAAATVTLGNLTAAGKSALSSRAEELWGYGTRITEQDIANAGIN